MEKLEKNNSNNETSNENVKDKVDVSSQKSKPRNRGQKRKRVSSSDIEDALPENTLEVEKNLHASAIKNNLDDVSVKKILKKVVTNDHVLALVKLREEEENSSTEENSLQPKLTRAKAKELMKVSPKAVPWNLELTPIEHIPVKTRPEVKALIAQELPEDEDDEEYEPTHDDVPSDDDQALESCSELESQPRTPATPKSQQTTSPEVVKDGPFKIPQELKTLARRKLDVEKEATIALRTRSKLSLSSTPIEHIESSFVPPDDLPMPDVDVLWDEFLQECLNPASTSKNEDDDEADPEYNVAADPDAHCEDEEALENSIIKISRKELNDLVTELFNIVPNKTDNLMMENIPPNTTPELTAPPSFPTFEGKGTLNNGEIEQQAVTFGSTDNGDMSSTNKIYSSEKEIIASPQTELTENNQNKSINEKGEKDSTEKTQNIKLQETANLSREDCNKTAQQLPPEEAVPQLLRHLDDGMGNRVYVTVDGQVKMLPEQVLILQQQLRQHIQIATTNYLQLFVHPDHWTLASTYKNYLVSLNKMCDSNSKSVVDVCNLKPALELLDSWEKSVSEDTPENIEMVKFIKDVAERFRRRCAQNSFFIGDFPPRLKQVVANSPVFLYPHLLPPMPFRTDAVRRFIYHRSEDELIALALDEFWDYVEQNPQLFKRPERPHPRHRWGLMATVQLICKYLFAWLPTKALYAHVINARKHGDKNNPIRRFFDKREIVPVKHKLLPFNPHMTLYEQPEHEMPRLWVRYLSKSSKRFRHFLYKRNNVTGQEPKGVEIELGKVVEVPKKNPLPIEFTKDIACNRMNVLPLTPKPTITDKVDVQIERSKPQATDQVSKTVNVFSVVQTSTGAYLVPTKVYQSINTVKDTPATTTSTAKQRNTVIANDLPEHHELRIEQNNLDKETTILDAETTTAEQTNNETTEHCKCCVLLRRICKIKQTVITDFFKPKNKKTINSNCQCNGKKYPKISKRLRLFLNYYKSRGQNAWLESKNKLQMVKRENGEIDEEENENEIGPIDTSYNLEDLAFVTSYQMKLLARASIARKPFIRQRLYNVFSNFDPNAGDVLWLTNELDTVFDMELVDMYKEFIGFLTPEQADEIDMFKDYFTQNCVTDLIKKAEEQVTDKHKLREILLRISAGVIDNMATSCDICSNILDQMDGYPKLAQYVFSLFPHRCKERRDKEKKLQEAACTQSNDTVVKDNKDAIVDYEADYSSSDHQDENCIESQTSQSVTADHNVEKKMNVVSENVIDTPELTITKTEVQDHSGLSMYINIVSEGEHVKSEPTEWKRDEDKLILEVLKQSLTLEECINKTTFEIAEDRRILQLICDSLTHKSVHEIKERILHLLQFLVLSDT